jgi:hypothetical protein
LGDSHDDQCVDLDIFRVGPRVSLRFLRELYVGS